ncbi:uncharacterized protein LOC135379103 [Ornithodoros turicata]|uniref:uncharacterized protein LOC135379103 n=1 Tax=Ornithodoros turicata TaxID=34597 RepID=UPI00313999F0
MNVLALACLLVVLLAGFPASDAGPRGPRCIIRYPATDGPGRSGLHAARCIIYPTLPPLPGRSGWNRRRWLAALKARCAKPEPKVKPQFCEKLRELLTKIKH